jgi:hypothetical protein
MNTNTAAVSDTAAAARAMKIATSRGTRNWVTRRTMYPRMQKITIRCRVATACKSIPGPGGGA